MSLLVDKNSQKQTLTTLNNFCVVLIPFSYYYPNVKTLSFSSMHMPVVSTSDILSGITTVVAHLSNRDRRVRVLSVTYLRFLSSISICTLYMAFDI